MSKEIICPIPEFPKCQPDTYILMVEDLHAETVTFGDVVFTRPMMEAMKPELEGRSTKDFTIKFILLSDREEIQSRKSSSG